MFFIPKKTYNSWVLNEQTCLWEAPVAYPTDGKGYIWDELIKNWELAPIGYPTDGKSYTWNENTKTWDLISQTYNLLFYIKMPYGRYNRFNKKRKT